ncbi:MAG: DUF3847 domain-containing protein [Lachnospiraceae bacterium]|nr:DUF3847 domain-containing protein [Lachnospiraceae bacterium]
MEKMMGKTREELEAELEKILKQKEQYKHKLQLLENRKTYMEKKSGKDPERTKRNHRLITRGAAIESIIPVIKSLSEQEFYVFMESISQMEQVQKVVQNLVGEKGGKA